MSDQLMVDLKRELQSSDPEDRRRATSRLSSLPIDEAIPLALLALGDTDWRVRKEATVAARGLLPSEKLITELVDALRTGDVGLCNAAVEVLGAAGAAATPHLDKALREMDPDGRKLVVEALGRTRDRLALAPLERALAEEDPNIRQTAAESVGALAAVAPEVVEELLLSVLNDVDPIVRLSALSGLDALGATIPWERLGPMLDDPTLRPLALAAVARARYSGAPAVLARALGASSGRTFEAALSAFALVPLDPIPDAALEALRAFEPALSERLVRAAAELSGEEDIERRRTALVVGAELGDRRIIQVAVSALGEPGVGAAALLALRRLGSPAAATLIELLDQTADGDEDADEVRTLYVEALAHVARGADAISPEALAALRRAANGRAPRAASRALHALGSAGDQEDLTLVEKILLNADGAVGYAAEMALASLAARHPDAALALYADPERETLNGRAAAVVLGALAEKGELGDAEPRTLRFLSQTAISDDAATRRSAAAALARLGGPLAIEALVYALADEEREVRRTAARGLGRLAALRDNAKLLGVVRASSDPELLSAAIRAAGELLSEARSSPPSTGVLAAPSAQPPSVSAQQLVTVLASMCEDPSAEVAIAALDALRRAAPEVPNRIEAMASALEHADIDVVKTAIVKLASVLSEGEDAGLPPPSSMAPGPLRIPLKAWQRISECLDHDLLDVRLMVAESICSIDPVRGREALLERARVERDPEVLAAIDAALSAAQRHKKGASGP